MSKENYKYEMFNDIRHRPLQAYNRFVYASNLLETKGKAETEDYLSLFSRDEKIDIGQIASLLKVSGWKRTKELVTQGVVFPENMTEEEKLERA